MEKWKVSLSPGVKIRIKLKLLTIPLVQKKNNIQVVQQ
jgi:hypothetical protein